MESDAYLDVLRKEFAAEDGSFLLTMRIESKWDKDAFSRLVEAMKICCERYADRTLLERWLADGFWYLSATVEGHTQHPAFRRPYKQEYYERAYRRLWDLADWFFTGSRPYVPGHGFEPLEEG